MIDRHIFNDILPAKKYLILMLISNIIQVFLIAASSYTIAYLADKLLFAKLNFTAAAPLLALLLFFFCSRTFLHYYNNLTAEKISLNLQSKLRYRLLEVLAYNAYSLHQNKHEGDWLALITKGVDKLDTYLTGFLPQLGILITFPPVLLLCAFINDWISGLIFLITAPLIPLFMILIGKIADKENKRQWQLFQQLTNYLSDLLPGLLILKVYNQINRQLQETNNNGKKFSDATLKVLRIAFLSAFMLEFIATLSIAVIAVNIGLRLLYTQAVFLPVFFILLIAPQFYQPFRQFGSAFHNAMNGITASTEIYSLINDFSTQKNKQKSQTNKTELILTKSPEITFNQVSFAYNTSNNLLDKLSFTIPAGSQTALIGKNGAGKSTIFKLLLQLNYPQYGKIYINGKNLQDLLPTDWRSQIGCVLQEPYIFATTIAENISLGRKCTHQDIVNAAQLANLDDFISTLPNGYNTVLGSEQKLSFGQKRRLGIARALLYKPKLLLLDEPMENLDSSNEQLIQSVLNNLKGNTTVLIIAHRQHTISHAEHIILLKNGKTFEFKNIDDLNLFYSQQKIRIASNNERNKSKGSVSDG